MCSNTLMRSTLRGLEAMCFSISAWQANGHPLSLAAIPITVIIQDPNEVARMSVGEKASPFP